MSEHVLGTTTVNVPKLEDVELQKLLKKGGYLNYSEFVRDALRRRIEELDKEVS